jgi:hypothetical protein
MTRTEAINLITSVLPGLNDERIAAVAEIVTSFAQLDMPLELTDEQHADLDRSREDFRLGRVYASDDYAREMSAFMTRLATKYPASS